MNRSSNGDTLGWVLLLLLMTFEFAGAFSDVLANTSVREGASQYATLDDVNAELAPYQLGAAYCLHDASRALSHATRALVKTRIAVGRGGKSRGTCLKTRLAYASRFAFQRSYSSLCNNFLTSRSQSTPLFLILLTLLD